MKVLLLGGHRGGAAVQDDLADLLRVGHTADAKTHCKW